MLYALIAAMVWGLDYSIAEKVFEKIPVQLYLFYEMIVSAILLGLYLFFSKQMSFDLSIFTKDKTIFIYFLIGILLFTIGNLLIVLGIKDSNATIAGLIEISYPFFIIIASYLLFKTNHLNIYTTIGGILIFSGVILIYLKSNN